MNYNIGELSLSRGRSLELNSNFKVKHPTLGEIEEVGHDEFMKHLYLIISSKEDVADILWFDLGIWYEDIKNDWTFFIQKSISENKTATIIRRTKKEVVRFEGCLIDDEYRDALNFFFNCNSEYCILEEIKDGTSDYVIYNLKINNTGNSYIDETCFKITNHHYKMIVEFLKKVFWINTRYLWMDGGNKKVKKMLMERQYNSRKKKKQEETVNLNSIKSSLVAKNHDAFKIWDYPIYLIYELYYRYIKINDYDNTITALYNGCIDTKKEKINWDKINWSGVIKQ